ncbi:uncharacterized protein LY79DRAFT_571879, partial [Colletotrichum navitas]
MQGTCFETRGILESDLGAPDDPATPKDPWFNKFKAIMAGVFGVCTASDYVLLVQHSRSLYTRPTGISVSRLVFYGGFAAGLTATGGLFGATVAAGVLYIVLLGRLFALLIKVLNSIWESIKNAV